MGMLLRRHDQAVVTKKVDIIPKVKEEVVAPKTKKTVKTEDEKAGE